ncbi:hypothetical protein HT031_001941 [Scenedesmus sp. PABB004]|nr:hypothetical protein HT031_001941 [Scenedesmus sp. PABB004]
MARLQIHPIGLAVVLFGLLSWTLALGGIGAATYGCQRANTYEFCAKTYHRRAARAAQSAPPRAAARDRAARAGDAAPRRAGAAPRARWEWWNLWFEFALLVALLACSFLEAAFRRDRLVFLAFFVLVTNGLLWSAHNFITELQIGPIDVKDVAQDAVNAAAAGYVLLGLANFVLIIILGKDFGAEPPHAYAATHHHGGAGGTMQFQTSAPV